VSPATDRIVEIYGESKDHALLNHARKMEGGLRMALQELERVDRSEDGHPIVSYNLMYNLRQSLDN
jgi:hypothetical protein